MPQYYPSDEQQVKPLSDYEKISMYGANRIVKPLEEPAEEANEILGGKLSDIMGHQKPHKEMIKAVLKMKPKDIHLIKRASKYFLDNADELGVDIDEGSLEDLSQTKNSNDLADMLENDYELTKNGEDMSDSLLRDLANLLDETPKLNKVVEL
mgnify:CR=1 FL=1|tara:strand:+ start:15633 stop:16091 length:459 start_codon:yes stop_codon:yes gene_type:complete